ncbi:MAG: HpcH/HpaI aldolase/citrate lyase family protein [Rhizobiaceae bacterium]
MRSLLFVPADSKRKLVKGLESGADVLIIDLEDSVAAQNKARARDMAADFIAALATAPSPALYVRVNDLATGLTDDDLAAVVAAGPRGIMLPKSNGIDDVRRLAVKLRVCEARAGIADGTTRIIPLITETALGVLNAGSYAVGEPRMEGLSWGAEDLSAAIGARETRDADGRLTDVFRLARATTILAASAADVLAIDTVFPDFRDADAFRRSCLAAERDGFTGCMAIHPAQVPVINEIFSPSSETIAEAQAVVAAFEAAGNPGVVAIDGKMFDRPHLRRAERLLERAQPLKA